MKKKNFFFLISLLLSCIYVYMYVLRITGTFYQKQLAHFSLGCFGNLLKKKVFLKEIGACLITQLYNLITRVKPMSDIKKSIPVPVHDVTLSLSQTFVVSDRMTKFRLGYSVYATFISIEIRIAVSAMYRGWLFSYYSICFHYKRVYFYTHIYIYI